MCLDTCLAIANVIFLLRTLQLPWALERKWLFCYAWSGAQDIHWKLREMMAKQTSLWLSWILSKRQMTKLANPLMVAVFAAISNLPVNRLIFGLLNTETDDEWSKRFSLKVSADIYNRAATTLQTGFTDKSWLLTGWPQQYYLRKYL